MAGTGRADGRAGRQRRKTVRLIDRSIDRPLAPAQSPKALTLRELVRKQFKENKDVTDPAQIQELKHRVELSLSHYLLFERTSKDPRFEKFRERAAEETQVEYEEDEHGNMYEVTYKTVVRRAAAPGAGPSDFGDDGDDSSSSDEDEEGEGEGEEGEGEDSSSDEEDDKKPARKDPDPDGIRRPRRMEDARA